MNTPQSIREKTFEKAVFGGYDMGAVDDFLETIATDLAAIQKENAVLKGKMKVLVDKIEEYRASEDAMRLALLSAQKTAKQITDEATQTAGKALAEARTEAERILQKTRTDVAIEEARLAEAHQASVQYFENLRLLSQKHLCFLETLSEGMPSAVVTPAPVEKRAIPASPVVEAESVHQEQEASEADLQAIGACVANLAEDVGPSLDVHPEIENAVPDTDADEPTRLFVK